MATLFDTPLGFEGSVTKVPRRTSEDDNAPIVHKAQEDQCPPSCSASLHRVIKEGSIFKFIKMTTPEHANEGGNSSSSIGSSSVQQHHERITKEKMPKIAKTLRHLQVKKFTPATLRYAIVLMGIICATFYFHMYLQEEYYRRCKSNVFRVVLFKQSHMCTHMLTVLTIIENTYFHVIRRIIESIVVPVYKAGMALHGLPT